MINKDTLTSNMLFMMVLGICAARSSVLAAQSESFTIAKCLQRAREHSHLLTSGEERINAARAAFDANKSQYYPQLSAEFAHAQLFYPPYDYRQQFGTATFNWSPGYWLRSTAKAAAKQVEIEQAGQQQILLDLAVRVSALYIGILRSRQELVLVQKRLEILAEHQQVAEALWHAGVRTELDVLQTRTAINSLQEQVQIRRTDIQDLEITLAHLLDLSPGSTLQLQGIPEAIMDIKLDSTKNMEENPQLLSLQLQAETRQLGLRAVQASRWPRLQLHGGYFVDRDPTAEGNYWQAGMDLQVPLFRWGETKFRQREIRAQVQALNWQKQEIRRELNIQKTQIVQDLDRLHQGYGLQQERLQITEEALQIATANYRAGLITNLEYLDAQKENVTAQVILNETRLAYALRLIQGFALMNRIDKIKILQAE